MFIPPRPPPSICIRCLFHLSARRSISRTHVFRTSVEPVPLRASAPPQLPARPIKWRAEYFLSNSFFASDGGGSGRGSRGSTNLPETPQPLLPHRRRQHQLRSKPKPAIHPSSSPATAGVDPATQIPPDASSLLSISSLSLPSSSTRRRLYAYLALCKPRLTALIVLSAMASYALFPVDPLLSEVPTLSALTLTFLTAGTALSAASANAFNMYLEPAYDGLMSRTRNRPLVRGLLTPRQALLFAIASGTLGVGSLYIGVNPTVAALGALNIALYAGVYTPLKRISVINTWVGAIVGGIPPLMGWAAAAGNFQTTDATPLSTLSHPGGWLLAALLFAWQFPHFTALSWGIREEYRRAGHQMMAWKYPALNARVALRYSLLVFPICAALTACGVTDVGFLGTSSLVNAWLAKEAWRFWKDAGERGSAKRLFWASVWHLPVIMGLAMIHKAGLWKGVYESVIGHDDEEGEEDEG